MYGSGTHLDIDSRDCKISVLRNKRWRGHVVARGKAGGRAVARGKAGGRAVARGKAGGRAVARGKAGGGGGVQ